MHVFRKQCCEYDYVWGDNLKSFFILSFLERRIKQVLGIFTKKKG